MGDNVKFGTEYEKFVQSVYQAILNAEGVDNVSVKHNIQLQGQSGCSHQIDVFWEFRLAGQIYKTAIECKNFNKPVQIGKVRDFYGVISGIPGLGGIFATKIDFQSGAKKFAAQKGISLKLIREPTDIDWQGRLRKIHFNMHIVNVDIISFEPRYTQSAINDLTLAGITEIAADFSTDETIIFTESGEPKATYEQMRQGLPHDRKPLKSARYFMPFPRHKYRASGFDIEIDGCEFVYNVSVAIEQSIIDGDDFVHAVMKDVESGDLTFVDKPDSPRRRS
jgi:hypothetical protein